MTLSLVLQRLLNRGPTDADLAAAIEAKRKSRADRDARTQEFQTAIKRMMIRSQTARPAGHRRVS